jgi:hypothetical protein
MAFTGMGMGMGIRWIYPFFQHLTVGLEEECICNFDIAVLFV